MKLLQINWKKLYQFKIWLFYFLFDGWQVTVYIQLGPYHQKWISPVNNVKFVNNKHSENTAVEFVHMNTPPNEVISNLAQWVFIIWCIFFLTENTLKLEKSDWTRLSKGERSRMNKIIRDRKVLERHATNGGHNHVSPRQPPRYREGWPD